MKTRILLTLTSFLLLLSMTLNLGGCMNSFASDDLMKGIKANFVSGKETDDAFILAQTELALKLFKASVNQSKNENVLISPLSILLALAMTANGADGETRAEMEALLGGDIKLDDLNEYIYTYVKSLPSSKQAKLEIANSIWFRDSESFTVEKDFLQTNADYYGAEIYKSAFDESTLDDINSWVSKNTDGMIEKIFEEINSDALMYLINALVFDAEWEKVYSETSISDKDFTSISGETDTVKMMHSTEYKYLHSKNATGVIKDYKGKKYSFAAILPDKGIDLYDYIDSLTAKDLREMLSDCDNVQVITQIPKFKYDYSLYMKNILSSLGMPSAFAHNADFSSVSKDQSIFVEDIIHKTFIDVSENGTKAAAVTGAIERAWGDEVQKAYVTLNRPFIYMIIDNETNLPIFIGAVTDISN
ncbi:MAG: serine protease [Ruminococcaceae bacterium]|nr:serine protease [Oscillospiraceae bacterium]